jgi:hypothetical protein
VTRKTIQGKAFPRLYPTVLNFVPVEIYPIDQDRLSGLICELNHDAFSNSFGQPLGLPEH